MTLADCIAAYEARRPAPIAPFNVLTPLGDATVTLYRLKRQIEALDPAQRAEIVGLAAFELGIVAGPEPLPAESESVALCLTCGEGYAIQDFNCPRHPATA